MRMLYICCTCDKLLHHGEPLWLRILTSVIFSSVASLHSMAMQLHSVCGWYQAQRETKGKASCTNYRHRCVYGPHRCGKCGNEGHGYYECGGRLPDLVAPPFWNYEPTVSLIPPVPPPPIRPRTMPAPAAPEDLSTPRSKSNPGTPRTHTPASGFVQPPPAAHVFVASGFAQPPPSLQASGFAQPPQPPPASQASGRIPASEWLQPPQPPPASQASEIIQSSAPVPMKGHGKGGVFGIQLPLPRVLSSPQLASANDALPSQVVPLTLGPGGFPPLPLGCPPPKKPDDAYCEWWFNKEFKVMKDAQRWPPHKGDEVLWKGVKVKSSGFESGKQEYFNGEVHDIGDTEEGIFATVC